MSKNRTPIRISVLSLLAIAGVSLLAGCDSTSDSVAPTTQANQEIVSQPITPASEQAALAAFRAKGPQGGLESWSDEDIVGIIRRVCAMTTFNAVAEVQAMGEEAVAAGVSFTPAAIVAREYACPRVDSN